MPKLLDILNNPAHLLTRLARRLKLTPVECDVVRARVLDYCARLEAARSGLPLRPDQLRKQRERHWLTKRERALAHLDERITSFEAWATSPKIKQQALKRVVLGLALRKRLRVELSALLIGAPETERVGRRLLPHLSRRPKIRSHVGALLGRWERQWTAVERAIAADRIRRCRQPDCGADGGRIFVDDSRNGSVLDCPYCVNLEKNHTQRNRNAKKRGTLAPEVRAIKSTRRIAQAAARAQRARLRAIET